MPRRCTVCVSASLDEVNAALARGNGGSGRAVYRTIARAFSLSPDAVRRHALAHLPAAVVACTEARDAVQAADLYGQTEALHDRAVGLLTKAETAGDLRAAVAAVHAARGCLELSAKMRTAAFVLARGATPDDPSDEEVEAATKILDARILILEARRGS